MIQLRELQKLINQSHSGRFGSPNAAAEDQVSCALWDLIQFVGERARRNTVLLMDRDNAEVFYSKVSEIEEVFHCLNRQLEYLIRAEQPLGIQVQRACELSNVCVTILRTALDYKNEHQLWYPLLKWSKKKKTKLCLMSIGLAGIQFSTVFINRPKSLWKQISRRVFRWLQGKEMHEKKGTGPLKALPERYNKAR
ncbi:unnamed protein product [Brassica oleracea]|uniref:Uncharacterized protein n=1 Tax=Brassica oleracea var. oleracea TaxID=109376 RepID=A0A0D3D4I1_BRAOL